MCYSAHETARYDSYCQTVLKSKLLIPVHCSILNTTPNKHLHVTKIKFGSKSWNYLGTINSQHRGL